MKKRSKTRLNAIGRRWVWRTQAIRKMRVKPNAR